MKLTAYLVSIMTLCMILITSYGFAQEKTLTGKVISPNGTAIQGATILERGTKNFTTSDADGYYLIKLSNSSAVIVVSFVGFTTQEIPTEGKSTLEVTLTENSKVLNEVIVTALGIKKEVKRIGYAVQEVKGSALTQAREPDAFNSLTGKVAGLTIGTSPELLGRPNIVMRGTKDALIVVDGVPINSDTWNINADDIESVSVLKGANAAALYGFRGQNGAIIVTTKKGSRDAKGWQIDVNSSTMLEKGFTALPKIQTEYGRGNKFKYSFGDQLYDAGQRLAIWGPRFEGQAVKQYNSPYDLTTGIRTATPYISHGGDNLQKFLQTGLLASDNISLSTSGAHSDIRISYSHVYQRGIGPNTRLNMDNLNIITGYDINSKLKFDANLNLNVQYTPNIPDANYGPNSYVYMFNVYGPADYDVNDLKNYYKGPQGVPGLQQYNENYGRSNNPYFMANEWLRGHYKTDIYGYIKLTYNINKDLNASIRTQVTTWDQLRSEKVPAGMILNQYLNWYYFGWYGDYREDHRNLLENNTDFLLNYNKKVSDFTIGANLGASSRAYRYTSTFQTTKDLAVPGVYNFSNSLNPGYAYSFNSDMQVYSGYYSVDFGYKNYFNISTTGRVDNLSTLPSGNNTFFYPSVAISSSLTDYLNLPKAISYLKLRASYADVRGGLTQSQIGSAYSQLFGTTLNSGLLGYGSELYTSYDGPSYANQSAYTTTTYYNGQLAVAYSSNIANPALKSFDLKSYEAGLDYRMFHNRVGLDVTYFQSDNGPLIYQLGVAPATGYTSQNVNAVTTLKKGWEISLNATPVKTGAFTWDLAVNWSTFKETLKSIYGSQTGLPLNNHIYHVGERMDAYYSTGFVRDGSGNIVYAGGAPLSPSPSGINNTSFLGYLNPDYSFGINNRFSYKDFSFSFQFDGRVGGKIYDYTWYHQMNGGTAVETVQGALGAARLAEWQSVKGGASSPVAAYIGSGVVITGGNPVFSGGKITNLKDLTFAPNTTPITVQNYMSSGGLGSNFDEYYMIDRTYAKLREVQLSYNFPRKMLGRSLIKSASVSLVGRNLLYFAKRKDFDIDQYASGFNITDNSQTGTSGDVNLSSPTVRRYGINIKLGF